ncbi:MAG TPA: hypothetical protein PKE64_25205 [Anaerolineae bacterium]|nr:hypothetical protein [Anaerolineae bacterium]HMR67324.1 hypothetical protein [Anaerolineae bacterium]
MEAYKFEVKVQENGIIEIPEISRFANQEVEIFIMLKPKTKIETTREKAVEKFLDKWQGFLKGGDPDELKGQYLQEKYG